MIFPEKMVYLKIRIPEEKIDEELKNIGLSGLLHIDTSKGKPLFKSEEKKVEYLLKKTEKFLDILGIKRRLKWDGKEHPMEEIHSFVLELEKEVSRISNLRKEIEKEERKLSLARDILKALKEYLNIPELIKRLKIIKIRCGVIPFDNVEPFKISLQAYGIFVVYGEITYSSVWFAALYTDDTEEILNSSIAKNQAEVVPEEYFKPEKEDQIKTKRGYLENLIQDIRKKYLNKLVKYNSYLKAKLKIIRAKQPVEQEDGFYVLWGWIPEKKIRQFKSYIKYSTVEIFPAGDNAPVLLKTPDFFKPFEKMIMGFSYPKYGEINPTIPFALTFLIFFGIMFGDVGHGIVLVILGLFLRKKYPDPSKIFVLSGVSSSLFGLVYGSFFGFHGVFPFALISPVHNIQELLFISIGVGIAVLSVSFVLNIISLYRRKKIKALFFGEGGVLWLLIYWYILGILVKVIVFRTNIYYDLILLGFLLFVVFVFIYIKSRSITESFINLMREILESITNTVSFIRLGAFALAHSTLFLAVFTVAKFLETEKGGGFFYWLTIAAGNIFIIILEGIIVAIQTLRLEYYEFFKRFFEGGGIPYKPFKI
ncbi:V-type ATP synthase subunit I [Persephonella sp.]